MRLPLTISLLLLSVTLQAQIPATPTQTLIGVDKLHRRGFKGQGMKIGLIDLGWAGTRIHHKSIRVAAAWNPALPGSVDTNHSLHAMPSVGLLTGKDTTGALMVGMCPEASFYSFYGAGGIYEAMVAARDSGMDAIVITFGAVPSWDERCVALAEQYDAEGRFIFVAAGNNRVTQDSVNIWCRLPHSYCVGSYNAAADTFWHISINPLSNSKGLDFVTPYMSYAPTTGNSYAEISGTSYNAPQMAFMLLLKQKYPMLSNRAIYHIVKFRGRTITNKGITAIIPQNLQR